MSGVRSRLGTCTQQTGYSIQLQPFLVFTPSGRRKFFLCQTVASCTQWSIGVDRRDLFWVRVLSPSGVWRGAESGGVQMDRPGTSVPSNPYVPEKTNIGVLGRIADGTPVLSGQLSPKSHIFLVNPSNPVYYQGSEGDSLGLSLPDLTVDLQTERVFRELTQNDSYQRLFETHLSWTLWMMIQG